jgi:hypothetical protein
MPYPPFWVGFFANPLGQGTMTLTINGESEEIMVGGAPNSCRLITTDSIEKGTR